VLFAGHDAGLRVPPSDAVVALLTAAHAFLSVREGLSVPEGLSVRAESGAWRVRELPDGPGELARRSASALGTRLGPGRLRLRPHHRELVGPLDHAAGALVPLGRLGPVALAALEKAGQLTVTAQRGVIVADLAPGEVEPWLTTLARAGLVVEPGSRWAGVTTCAGRPGCGKALADVRADAAATVAAGLTTGLPVHWVGCARGCGSPGGRYVRAEATADGYAVTAPGFEGDGPASDVAALVTAARRS
jgi:precorrin-3B synthase